VPERDEDWPTLSEVVRYRDRVRERVLDLYLEFESGKRALTKRLARTLAMMLEHDAFHIEVRDHEYQPGINVDHSLDAFVYGRAESDLRLFWDFASSRYSCSNVG
jgi:hypothetical protein